MKIICLLSGGIDSPVAAAMLMKKHDVVLLHIDNYPLASKTVRKKVIDIAKVLKRKKKITLYIVKHSHNLKEFMKVGGKSTCILCKRMMYRIANEIARKEKADAITTGDSLAQVASQTLSNLATESKASKLPVLRPLIGLDKEEITRKARKYGTYEISIRKEAEPSGCGAVPKHPRTRSEHEEIERLEKNIQIKKLLKKSMDSAEKIIL